MPNYTREAICTSHPDQKNIYKYPAPDLRAAIRTSIILLTADPHYCPRCKLPLLFDRNFPIEVNTPQPVV